MDETPQDRLERLVALVARLRRPDGCPWDREQTLADVRPYLLEEAHETAAAIDRESWDELAGELGDLLFQIAFVARLAEEAGEFTLDQVVERIADKMVRRHPHVFGGEALADADAVHRSWEQRKARARHGSDGAGSLLDGVADTLPALVAAYRMAQKAAGVGFDWPGAAPVIDKLREELGELEAAVADGGAKRSAGERRTAAVREELGDLLFTVANLARHLEVDPEAALAAANTKFRRRFAALESRLGERGESLADAGLDRLEAVWREVKAEEPGG